MYPVNKPGIFCPTNSGFEHPSKHIIEFPAPWDAPTAASSDKFGWQ